MQPATINHYPIRSKSYPVFYPPGVFPGTGGRGRGRPESAQPGNRLRLPAAPGGNVLLNGEVGLQSISSFFQCYTPKQTRALIALVFSRKPAEAARPLPFLLARDAKQKKPYISLMRGVPECKSRNAPSAAPEIYKKFKGGEEE